MEGKIKLTQYSHGAGCGCKIAPSVLEELIQPDLNISKNLLVGNHTKDDAAVYDIGNGQAVISTTDFFMPIVDDPYDFGYIAAVNALSDIYAMGGTPMMAIAILGWPIEKIPVAIASEVLRGGRAACKEASINVAGGHSIDNPEPIFGLAVTGQVSIDNLKRNNTAKADSTLYLTKPLGVGLISTAQKRNKACSEDLKAAVASMKTLNDIGVHFGKLDYVNAMTDVTGFGLLGHLLEMCEGADVSAEIERDTIPVIDGIEHYIGLETIPGGTKRNWESYSHKVSDLEDNMVALLADPQTSGGLLVSVDGGHEENFEKEALNCGLELKPIGITLDKREPFVTIID